MLFVVCVCCLSVALLFLVGDGYIMMPAISAPSTGDSDMLIALALILIAGFLLFILLKNRRK